MERVDFINSPEDVKPSVPNESRTPATSIFQFAPQADAADGNGDGGSAPPEEKLPLIRLSRDRLIAVAFTMAGTEVQVHYCKGPELFGYVRCNGEGCALCRSGKEVKTMFLIPLYVPAHAAVEVLAVSQATTPGALLPKLLNLFASSHIQIPFMLALVKVGDYEFSVALENPKDGVDFSKNPIINAFLDEYGSDPEILVPAVSKIDNAALAQVPEIGRVLELLEGTHAYD
ncbi:MAG: hypothetical protein KQJ78_15850 [Deltaproteobacteria bacterium]|nr:hypothetical protein [Deltaproteobacteria bacterium]